MKIKIKNKETEKDRRNGDARNGLSWTGGAEIIKAWGIFIHVTVMKKINYKRKIKDQKLN